LLSPTYVDEKQRLASMLAWGKNKTASLDRDNAETAKYARACGELYNSTFKNDRNVGYIDMFDHFNRTYPTDENKTNILRDGLHFSAVGDRIFFELVRWKIEQMVPAGELAYYQFPPDSKYIHYDD
jgi:lysophospholipase L1-like esterase